MHATSMIDEYSKTLQPLSQHLYNQSKDLCHGIKNTCQPYLEVTAPLAQHAIKKL